MGYNASLMKKTNTKTENQAETLIAQNTVLTLTIPASDAQKAYAKALNKIARNIKIAGFRKGKVPAKIAEESVDNTAIIEEALKQLLPTAYEELVKKENKKPLTYPDIKPVSIEKDKDWTLEVHIAERPTIDLKDYKKEIKSALKSSVAELEKTLKEQKEKFAEAQKEAKTEEKKEFQEPTDADKESFMVQFVYSELLKTLKPQIQELLVKEEVRYDLDDLVHRLKHMNIELEKFLEYRKMTFEDLSSEMAASALGRLQLAFLIDEIAKKEDLKVEDKDLDEAFAKVTDPDLKAQREKDPNYIAMMSQTLLRKKVADFILSLK